MGAMVNFLIGGVLGFAGGYVLCRAIEGSAYGLTLADVMAAPTTPVRNIAAMHGLAVPAPAPAAPGQPLTPAQQADIALNPEARSGAGHF